MYKYYLAYKPFAVLCQFTKEKDDDRTLQELKIVDKDVYSVGRLDKDSEDMLLLTNDNKLKNAITHAENKIYKSYYCQVEGLISTLIRVGIGNLKLQFPIDFKVKSIGKKELDLIFWKAIKLSI